MLGDLAVAAGDSTSAAEHDQAALAIAERLAGADPANAGYQRDLSISHNRLASLSGSSGEEPTDTEPGSPDEPARVSGWSGRRDEGSTLTRPWTPGLRHAGGLTTQIGSPRRRPHGNSVPQPIQIATHRRFRDVHLTLPGCSEIRHEIWARSALG